MTLGGCWKYMFNKYLNPREISREKYPGLTMQFSDHFWPEKRMDCLVVFEKGFSVFEDRQDCPNEMDLHLLGCLTKIRNDVDKVIKRLRIELKGRKC